MSMTVEQARALMHEWVSSESLRTHMECVAACCGSYAEEMAPDERERWVVTGLLHDFDYERHPSAEEHPWVGVRHLESLGVEAPIREAILGHAEYTGTPRTSDLARVLYACDELAGFIVACAKVRPNGIADLKPKSVKKKLKTPAFAAAVNREDIARGIEELGIDRDEHLARCIEAIRAESDRLGL